METQESVKYKVRSQGIVGKCFRSRVRRGNPVLAYLRYLFNDLTSGKNLACVQPPRQNFSFQKRVSEIVMVMIQGPIPERPITANP